MGEIRSKRCEGRELTKDQLAGHRHYHHRPAERCHRHGALKENPGSDCPQLLCALAIKMAGGLRGLGAALPIYMWRAACGYIIGAGLIVYV